MDIISEFSSSVRDVGGGKGAVRWVLVVIAAIFLAGCAKGFISKVELHPTQPIVCNTSVTPNVCGVSDNQPVWFNVRGKGMCNEVFLQCGNGLSGTPHGYSQDFGQPPTDTPLKIECRYDGGWPGPKTVRAYSNGSDCKGEETLRVNVLKTTGGRAHANFWLGLTQPFTQPPVTSACSTVPNVNTPLRSNTRVAIKTNPDPNVKINFGCWFSGCIYDADGEPNSIAPASFSFPGFRKYSLVFRVGQQVVQGGTDMNFTTNQGGHLEVCVNDERLDDNTGAWGIEISVDESQAH